MITWNAAEGLPVVDSPSGHAQGDGKGIDLCVDGRADTKWCVADPGGQVVWRAAFPVAEIELTGAPIATGGTSIPADYRRALDIATGIHTTTFTQGGVKFTREAFASRPDQVMAFRYTTSKPGALSGRIILKSGQKAKTQATEHGLSFTGEMPNKLKHACAVRVLHKGGTIVADDDEIAFVNCDDLTLLVNAHIADLSLLLGRVALEIGATAPEVLAMPTDARLKRYAQGQADPDLEETMFYYGRYLQASCSRPGGLPANLQGLWNDSNNPPWASDYHNNINLQMNYWGAESTNLSECHLPLIDFVVAAQKPCRIATRKAFGANVRGWTARTSRSIFGGNGWEWNITDMQAHLAPNRVGKWGQLQEWQTDRDEPNDTHRHTSHLFAVYPGRQIGLARTPDLARAAIVSLKARSNDRGDKPFGVDTTIGDSRRSWTWPWRCGMWARLGEGDRAGIMVRGLPTHNTLPNLFCNRPPFQMDGNFGITGAVAEMLLQSHAGEIAVIPAIPKAWAASGSFKGLKARGNFMVDATWQDGKVINFAIRSPTPRPIKVRVNGEARTVNATKE